MAVTPEDHTQLEVPPPSSSSKVEQAGGNSSDNGASSASKRPEQVSGYSTDSGAEGLNSVSEGVNRKELQALVTTASGSNGVELAAESSTSSSSPPGDREPEGTLVRVVESEPEIRGDSSAAGGPAEGSTRQIDHIVLPSTNSSSPPLIPDPGSKGRSDAAEASSSSAGTVIRVVTESGTEIVPRNSTSVEGSWQISNLFGLKAKSEAGKKKTTVVGDADADSEEVDLEKGLTRSALQAGESTGVDKNGRKDSTAAATAAAAAAAAAAEYEAGEEPVCRVCQVNSSPKEALMDLGCACKRDLAHAHRECAETWFRVRGNRKCEICGEIAQNVQLVEAPAGTSADITTTITVVTVHHRYACQNRPVRVLLAFLIAAFLVPWLFRFAYRQ
ncbi:hypothetical protein R1sor_022510 [Riccia sorocarpa]|uniref:RING-CH-type domain-containing protein n=1 Tax=Riccia sorocarpa TaxID=122646 RepID=A0ABD3GP98_9MARC